MNDCSDFVQETVATESGLQLPGIHLQFSFTIDYQAKIANFYIAYGKH
uniref:Uncharacterized protein n=1 Tax=uncultured Verrucomicrobiales bacterium HF0130_14P10 TaxID=723606 RepID=E7C2M3_9BACT|nr:hypothetical protein [uncultured Verrucomicrobiales bacterium HF0130_14P10]